jgi:hypothetical protein
MGTNSVPLPNVLGDQQRQADGAALRSHLHPFPSLHLEMLGVAGIDLQKRLGVHFLNLFDPSGAGLGVPVAVEPSGRQHKGVVLVGGLGQALFVERGKAGAAIGGGKSTPGVEALVVASGGGGGGFGVGAGPLNGAQVGEAIVANAPSCRRADRE